MPEWIGQLHNLMALSVSDNQLTILPKSLGKLHNLTNGVKIEIFKESKNTTQCFIP